METETKCPTCRKHLAQPLKLPCSHVLCAECVADITRTAQLTGRSATCPLCRRLLFAGGADDVRALPESEYHGRLLRLFDPSGVKVCVECHAEDPHVLCQDGCGAFCSECGQQHRRSVKTRSHQTKPIILASAADPVHDANRCIFHNSPITSLCDTCLDTTELCDICLAKDKKENPTHVHRRVSSIVSDIASVERVSRLLEQKSRLVESSLERIAHRKGVIDHQRSESIEIMKNIFSGIKRQIEAFESETLRTIEETCGANYKFLEAAEEQNRHIQNMLLHGLDLMRDARNLYESQKAISKVVKSKRFADAINLAQLQDVPDIQLSKIDYEKHRMLLISEDKVEFILRPPRDVEQELKAQISKLSETVQQTVRHGQETRDDMVSLGKTIGSEAEKVSRLEVLVKEINAVVGKIVVPGATVTHENAVPHQRVKRSKTWNRGDEDGGRPGTLVKAMDGSKMTWSVKWDSDAHEKVYCTGFKGQYHLEFC